MSSDYCILFYLVSSVALLIKVLHSARNGNLITTRQNCHHVIQASFISQNNLSKTSFCSIFTRTPQLLLSIEIIVHPQSIVHWGTVCYVILAFWQMEQLSSLITDT